MNSAAKNALFDALMKYGQEENLCFSKDLQKNWDEFASYETINVSITADIDLRHKLINQGRILEENLEKHYYYWLIEIKGLFAPEALVVTLRDNTSVQIGAYANQGLASKRYTVKAIEQVKNALLK